MMIINPENQYHTNLHAAIENVSSKARGCLVPILRTENRYNFEVTGTSVLIEFNGKIFLISASHVFKDKETIYYVPGIRNLVPLTGPSIEMASNYKEDKHDIKIVYISEILFKEFNSFSPIKIRKSDALKTLEPETNVVLIGYPNSRNKKFRGYINKFSMQALTNTTADYNNYLLENYDPDLHILIHYNKKINFTENNNRVDFPDPHGISGGGIWRLFLQKDYLNYKNNFLAGIIIEKSNSNKFIVGVNLKYVMKALVELENRIINMKSSVSTKDT